jgi:hypothetical protein
MVEIIDYFAGFISGLLVSVIVSYVQFWFSKKTLNMELEQNERNLKLQLTHDDRNKAFAELFRLMDRKYKSYFEFQSAVESFLNSLSGALIPSEIARDIRQEFLKIGAKLDEIGPPEPSPEEEEHWERQFEEYYESLPIEERVETEAKNMTQAFKSAIKEQIRKKMSTI